MSNFVFTFHNEKGSFELGFSYIEGYTTKKYFVIVHYGDYRIATFEMKQDNDGRWKVIEPAPDCVFKIESTLSRVIEEHTHPYVNTSV